MELWQAVFLISLVVSMLVAITWDTILGIRFREIEKRQLADPLKRPHMDFGQIHGFGRSYRARHSALRLAEPERSEALRETDRLQVFSRTIMVVTAAIFLAMVVSLMIR
jgi:hypothetical protein